MATSPVIQQDVKAIVDLVGEGFDRLSGKTLLITGGTGFIGSYLLETVAYLNDQVLAQPCQAYVTTRDPGKVAARFPHLCGRADLTLIEGDVRTFKPLSMPLHFVIHAAAASDARVFLQDPLGAMETIADGTRAVLTIAADAEIEGFLFVSSGAVYGHQPADCLWVPETYTGGPDLSMSRSCYAEAKRYAELLCRVFQETRGLPISIARLFTLVGPYQDLNSTSAVVDFIRQALSSETIRVRDAGTTQRSYCYIGDAVASLWTLLLGTPGGEAVNVGSDLESVSFVELAERIGRCLGKPVRVVMERAPASGILGARYAPDVSRLYRVTGFRPQTTLDQALTCTIAWMQERQAGHS